MAIPKQTVVEEARDDKRKREREDARKRASSSNRSNKVSRTAFPPPIRST